MADMEETSEEGSGKKKLVIIIIAAVISILVIGVIVLFLFFRSGDNKKSNDEAKMPENEVEQEITSPVISAESFYPGLVKIPETIVELVSEDNSNVRRKLRISFYIKVGNDELKYVLLEKSDLIINKITEYLQGMKLSDIDESFEKILLKQTLIKKISDITGGGKIENIYFSEFLILDW